VVSGQRGPYSGELFLIVHLAIKFDLTALTASSTDHVMVNLSVSTVKQDSPVQIVGFKLPGSAPAAQSQSESTDAPQRAGVPLVSESLASQHDCNASEERESFGRDGRPEPGWRN
jgi:hypothetical protein